MSEVQNYVPIISERLTRYLETNPEIAEQATIELHKSAAIHTNDVVSVTPENTGDFQRLDCVGLTSSLTYANQDAIETIVTGASTIAGEVISRYLTEESALNNFAKKFKEGNKISLVYDHRGLLEVAFGAACFLYALYEKKHFVPGEIDMEIIVGTMTKYTSIYDQPVVNALIDGGIFQHIRFVVPVSRSTESSPALLALQPKFNDASARAVIKRKEMIPDNKIVETISPSASTDKLLYTPDKDGNFVPAYHMAPAYGSLKHSFSQLMGIGKDPDGTSAVYVGELLEPTKDKSEVDRRMARIAWGMSSVSEIPSIYHPTAESYELALEQSVRAV